MLPVCCLNSEREERHERQAVPDRLRVSAVARKRRRPSGPRPRGDNPLNLSILISGGKETNRDSPSKGD